MSIELERRAQVRADRATQAAISARRRTPVGVVVLGVILFFVSLVVLLLAAKARSSAIESLAIEQETLHEISKRTDLIADLKSKAANKTDDRVFLPRDPAVAIKNAAPPELRSIVEVAYRNSPGGSSELRKFTYNDIQHVSADLLLQWVENATSTIPGLYLDRIKLTPMPQFWRLDCDFIGWEKK